MKLWRKNTKQRIVDSLGGKCVICGYCKCVEALDCHHVNPAEKDFSLASIRANSISWKRIVVELRKCVLLCKVCHAEYHYGYAVVPGDAPKFNEEYTEYRVDKWASTLTDQCPICSHSKPIGSITCSKTCAGKRCHVLNRWQGIDLNEYATAGMDVYAAADILKIAVDTVRRQAKKAGVTFRRARTARAVSTQLRRRRFDPDREALEKLVWQFPTTEVAARFNVSDVAVSKRCRLLRINKPPRGYWEKLRAGKIMAPPD